MNPPLQKNRSQPVRQPPLPRGPELQTTTFAYADRSARRVFVAGDFNNWSPTAMPLTATTSGGWATQVKLTPGRHEYLFVVDGKWMPDPKTVSSAPNPHGERILS